MQQQVQEEQVVDERQTLVDELQEMQQTKRDLANLPEKLEVNGKVIELVSRPMGEAWAIDDKIFELQMLNIRAGDRSTYEGMETGDFFERVKQDRDRLKELMYEIVVDIIDNKSMSTKWVKANMHPNQVNTLIDMYVARHSSELTETVKKIMSARTI